MNLAEDPRAGLEISRYHSWAVHRTQSTGEHSAQIMRILLSIWPDCPRRMLVHAVTHDIGEMAGDIQWPYKQKVPGLKELADRAEHMVREEMREAFPMPPIVALSDYEERVFKICEYLEMWEYGLREANMGNKYAHAISMRMLLAAGELLDTLSVGNTGFPDVRPAIKSYVDTRTKWELE